MISRNIKLEEYMESIRDVLKQNSISLSLPIYGMDDLATGWEVKSVIENHVFFLEYYDCKSLDRLITIEDYYDYLIALKLISFTEVVPLLLHEEHKPIISEIIGCVKQSIAKIDKSEVIRYINTNASKIFSKESFEDYYDVFDVTLNIIAKYNSGIKKEVFEILCKECKYYLVVRFDQFERIFELFPDLFEMLYPINGLEYINFANLERTLDIWYHILNKNKSNLKESVNKQIELLFNDLKYLADSLTVENVLINEGPIREFYLFLQQIQSPMANEFVKYAKAAEELLSKNILERGQSFQYEIPIEEIISKWKQTEKWEFRLLSLTHDLKATEDYFTFLSRLSCKPEPHHPLIDIVSTNVPTDDYFTISHQQRLSISASIGTGTMLGILRSQDTLIDYLSFLASAISLVIKQLNAEGEHLQQDISMLSAMLQLVVNNPNISNDAKYGMCYSASMYMCALSEKILRILYLHLAKNEKYIPINKATMGELLVTSNTYMVDVFGEDHIKNLSFFLQKTTQMNVGQNIRNSLAHWANISTESMKPDFLAKMLWIFTDIINTVFWYCLSDVVERNESND